MCPTTAPPEGDRMHSLDDRQGEPRSRRRTSVLQASAAARCLLAAAVAVLLWVAVAWAMR